MPRPRTASAAAWLRIWGIAFRAWPAGVLLSFLSTPLVVVGAPLSAIAVGRLVDTSSGGMGTAAVMWAVVLVATTVALDAFYSVGEYASDRLEQLVQHTADGQLMEFALRAEGIEHLENPELSDQLQLMQASPATFANLLNNSRSLVGGLIGLALTVSALAVIEPFLCAIPLASIGSAILDARVTRRQWAGADEAAVQERMAREYESLLTTAAAAKETRLYGLAPWLRARFVAAATAAIRIHRRGEIGKARAGAARGMLHAIVLGAAALWLVRGGVRSLYSVGEVVTGIALLRQLLDSSAVVAFVSSNTAALGELTKRFDAIVQYRSSVEAAVDGATAPVQLRDGVELRDVTFRYPGGERYALRSVSLRLEPGTVVALVGENGSGKTTLTKLLCRFYDPETGAVTVDGHDLRSYAIDGWRGRVTGTLQDFARPQFVLRVAVGMGQLGSLHDDDTILEAMRMAGAESIVHRLRDGLETQLGLAFDGEELSGGQWQKVALARGFMRVVDTDGPLLLILDEPAASLDVRSEQELVDRVLEAAHASRGRGCCTLLVSHRLATAATADWIVVMGDGRVVEQGTHDDLLQRGGAYAELFQIHSAPYLDAEER